MRRRETDEFMKRVYDGEFAQESLPPWSIGSIIAICVLIVVIVLAVIGRIPTLEALLFGGLALARLL
jgi:hypothetical protein